MKYAILILTLALLLVACQKSSSIDAQDNVPESAIIDDLERQADVSESAVNVPPEISDAEPGDSSPPELPGDIPELPNDMQASAITMQELVTHNNSDSCWLLIDGKVYDVTEFVQGHPGGQAILEGCGIDSTELYDTRPMGSGTPHSDRAREGLENYYIGDIEILGGE